MNYKDDADRERLIDVIRTMAALYTEINYKRKAGFCLYMLQRYQVSVHFALQLIILPINLFGFGFAALNHL